MGFIRLFFSSFVNSSVSLIVILRIIATFDVFSSKSKMENAFRTIFSVKRDYKVTVHIDDDICARAKEYLKNCIIHSLEKIHIDHTRHPSRNKKSYNKESSCIFTSLALNIVLIH